MDGEPIQKGDKMFCPQCDAELKLIPAGTSKKTGKPYKAFYACPVKECGYTCWPKTPIEKRIAETEKKIINNSIPELIRTELGKAFGEIAMLFSDIPGEKDGEWHEDD